MKIIGLTGNRKSGKDTFIELLKKNFNNHDFYFYHGSFADQLKKLCMEIFNLTENQCHNQKYKEKSFKFLGLFSYKKTFKEKHIDKIIKFLSQHKPIYIIDDEQKKHMRFYLGRQFSTPREILQFIGTEILRDIVDSKYHIKTIETEIEYINEHYLTTDFFIVTDVRFPNEYEWLKKNGGKLIKIERPTTVQGIHRSETEMNRIKPDYIIKNDTTLTQYFLKIKQILNEINLEQ